MNDFLIELQAKLDEAKSKGNINSDISKIQNQIDKLKVQAEIDPKALSNLVKQLGNVLNQKINISNINIDTSNAQKTGQKIGQTVADSTQKAIDSKNINVDKLNADVKTLTNSLNNFSSKNEGFNAFKTEINGVEVSLDSLISKLSTVDNETDLSTIRSQAAALKSAFTELQKINQIQLSLDNGHGVNEYQLRIQSLINDFEKYGISVDKAENETAQLSSILNKMNGLSGQELVAQADKFEQEFKAVKISIDAAKQSYDKFTQPVSDEKISSLMVKIQNFLSKNTAITEEAKVKLNNYIKELSGGNIPLSRWNAINAELSKTESSMRTLGKLGASLKDQLNQARQSFTQWMSVSTAVMLFVTQIKNAISELKEVDTLLTEISKANDSLTDSELSQIGNDAFEKASKYGKTATDYLAGVQEMSRAGYKNADSMAELSTAAQGAGDMTADLANQYIIATDKAYKMNGSIEALTATLDGANNITNHNAVNMTELAEGMSVVGSQAASSQMKIDETTAAIATLVAVTQKSGSEMGNAFKGILMNLQQVTGEVEDGGDAIDESSLTKYEKACNELGVSLSTVKDGVVSLKEPMQILKELSEEYTKLDESDARRANLLSAVGGKYRANALNAILENYDLYEKMLQDYANGTGSMAEEANLCLVA